MDIELKKVRYSFWFKILAWVLCVGCALGAFAFLIKLRGGAEVITDQYVEYSGSKHYFNYMNNQLHDVFYGYGEPGKDDIAHAEEVYSLYNEKEGMLAAIEERYNTEGDRINAPELYEQERNEKQEVEDKYNPMIAEAKKKALDKVKKEWDTVRQDYQSQIEVSFAIYHNGVLVETNLPGDPGAALEAAPEELTLRSQIGEWDVAVLMSQEQYEDMAATYGAQKDNLLWALIGMCVCLVISLGALIWLLVLAGHRPVGEGIVMSIWDVPFLDVSLFAILVAGTIFVNVFGYIALWEWLPWVGFAILANLCLYWVVCVAKRLKVHGFWKHTLIYWLWRKLWLAVQKTALGWRVFWAAAGYVALGILICFVVWPAMYGIWKIFGLLLIAAYGVGTVFGLLRPLSNLKRLNVGLQKIQSGDLNTRIEGCSGRIFEEMAESINHMTDGFRAAVDREVKSEKMKSQLITNVSHDLKTPLTSIITYVDLLKKEELSQTAGQYVDILERKSQRLKQLTDTLFEAAKASGGDIIPVMKPIELRQFLEQVLGETEDQLAAAGLTMISDLGKNAAMVIADGALLWRVMGNLIENACKYSPKDSRVYLTLKKEDRVEIEMKNISAEPLNISEEELMERFVRGDSSRHSEGSGLGLSIAKSYVELMGGEFRIMIDGDLFKAVIQMDEYR